MSKHTELQLPDNRIIRKRIAARTVGVHLSALTPELRAFSNNGGAYLAKHDLPDYVYLTLPNEERQQFTRVQAWKIADEAGEKMEREMLPDTWAGKTTAFVSSTGQGPYADYGRPSVDFIGFAHDGIISSGQHAKNVIPQGLNNLMLGPIFVAGDTLSAAGFTALGHVTRGAHLTDQTVLSDVASTGVFEGSTAWGSAKLGVFTGMKTIGLTALLPIPGARLAAIPVGIVTGLATAVMSKHLANSAKDVAVDATQKPRGYSKTSNSSGEIIGA